MGGLIRGGAIYKDLLFFPYHTLFLSFQRVAKRKVAGSPGVLFSPRIKLEMYTIDKNYDEHP